MNRRRFLRAAGVGSVLALSGCSGSSKGLQAAFLRVIPPDDSCDTAGGSPSTGDVNVALLYASAPSDRSLPDVLRTSRGEVTTESDRLGWNEPYYDESLSDSLVDGETAEKFATSERLGLDPDRTLHGRIVDGVRFPDRPMYTGGATSFPEVRFVGEIASDAGPRSIHIQFSDGYVYNLPRRNRSGGYPGDERYQIDPDDARVISVKREVELSPNRGLGELSLDISETETVRPDARTLSAGTPPLLVDSFRHRSHPILAVLRASAQRRMSGLYRVAKVLDFGSVEAYIENINDQTQDAVTQILLTVGSAPSEFGRDPSEEANRQNIPVALADQFSGGGGSFKGVPTPVSLVSFGMSVDASADEVRAWGDTIGDDPALEISDRCFTAELRYDFLVDDAEGRNDDCSLREFTGPTTPTALAALSVFTYERAIDAIAGAGDPLTAIDRYDGLLRETYYQTAVLERLIGETLSFPLSSDSFDLLSRAQSYYGSLTTPLETELSMLEELREAFTAEPTVVCPDEGSTPTAPPEDDGETDDRRPIGERIDLDPRSTFLRTDSSDDPAEPTVLDLSELGLSGRDRIEMEVVGEYTYGGALGDTRTQTIAVFSESDTLLDPSERDRVPDAIGAGPDFETWETYRDGLATDVPEDFRVDPSVTVTVPEGATHLFVAAHDDLYYDNADEEDDYGIRISVLEDG